MMFSGFKGCCGGIKQRYVFAVMCFLGLFNAYSMRACLSIAITEMAYPPVSNAEDNTCKAEPAAATHPNSTVHNGNSELEGTRYNWDEATQSVILLSFYAGYIFTHLPGGVIAERYGGKHTLGIGILLTAIFTIATPPCVYWFEKGYPYGLIVNRVLMGFGEGTTYPAINVLLAKWTPPNEISRIGSFVYAGNLMGTIFSTTVSGYLLKAFAPDAWPLVFYAMGATGIIWFVFWCVLCYSTPQEHPFIAETELNYLKKCISQNDSESSSSSRVPWRYVLTSKPVWALTIAIAGYNWGILTIITYLPKYMGDVLKVSVEKNGYLTSVVYLCMWIGGTVFSWVADKLISSGKIPATRVRKYGATIALLGSSCFIMLASLAQCNVDLVITMFAVGMTLMGASLPGLMVNGLDLSPNFAGTIMALSNGAAAVTGVVSPFIIGKITPNGTLGQWRVVYVILLGVSLVTNVIFLVFGDGKLQAWNDPDFKKNQQRSEQNQQTVNDTKV